MPAVIPQTITAPAAGTARRLAGSEARGSGPKAASSTGATPSCAAIVTPSGSVHHGGPGSAALTTGPSAMMASEAATDSWNPSDPTRSGSMTNSSVTATASTRNRAIGRPTVSVTAAMAAIAAALDTDGSKRVMSANSATTARTSASRGHRRRRRPTGAITASTKATFSPDTARRWVRPAPRKSSVSVAGWARSSPITRPVKSDRSIGRSDAAPSDSARRMRLAKAATAPAGGPGSIRPARRRAETWRTTSQGAGPTTGASCPVTRMCSPANRGAERGDGRPGGVDLHVTAAQAHVGPEPAGVRRRIR